MIPCVDKDFAELIPPLSKDELALLEQSIKAEGCRDALVVWNGVLLDGHNRKAICERMGVPFKTIAIDLPNRDAAQDWIIRNQLGRRNLTRAQWEYFLGLRYNREKQSSGGQVPNSRRGQNEPAIRTSEKLAAEYGVSPATVKRAGKTAEILQANPAKLKAVMSEKTETIASVKKEMRIQAKAKRRKLSVTDGISPTPRLILGRAEATGLPAASVDLIITSPPYNLGHEDWPMGGGREPRKGGIGYNDAMDEAKYQAWQVGVLVEMWRVAKDGASFFYNHKVRQRDGAIIHPMDWLRNKRNKWIVRQEIIWDRGSTHNHCANLFWPHDERIYWMTKGKPALEHPVGMPSIWAFHGPVADTWHPAPFAEELPERCMQAVGRSGIVVLDPFMGSGTTLLIASKLGYESIGVDISEDYINRAKEENGWTQKNNS